MNSLKLLRTKIRPRTYHEPIIKARSEKNAASLGKFLSLGGIGFCELNPMPSALAAVMFRG